MHVQPVDGWEKFWAYGVAPYLKETNQLLDNKLIIWDPFYAGKSHELSWSGYTISSYVVVFNACGP